jgi:hypothetical protein
MHTIKAAFQSGEKIARPEPEMAKNKLAKAYSRHNATNITHLHLVDNLGTISAPGSGYRLATPLASSQFPPLLFRTVWK